MIIALLTLAAILSGLGELLFTPRYELALPWVQALRWDTHWWVVDSQHLLRGAGMWLAAAAVGLQMVADRRTFWYWHNLKPRMWRENHDRLVLAAAGRYLCMITLFYQVRNIFYHSGLVMRPEYNDYGWGMFAVLVIAWVGLYLLKPVR